MSSYVTDWESICFTNLECNRTLGDYRSADKTVKVWDLGTRTAVSTIQDTGEVWSVSWRPKPPQHGSPGAFVTGGEDGVLRWWRGAGGAWRTVYFAAVRLWNPFHSVPCSYGVVHVLYDTQKRGLSERVDDWRHIGGVCGALHSKLIAMQSRSNLLDDCERPDLIVAQGFVSAPLLLWHT